MRVAQKSLAGPRHGDLAGYRLYRAAGRAPDEQAPPYAIVDDTTFSNQGLGYLLATIPQSPWMQLGLSYQLNVRDFDFETLQEERRDGTLHRFTLTQDFFIPWCEGRHPLQLSPYIEYGREAAEGNSSDNHFWQPGLFAQWILQDHLQLRGLVSFQDRDFVHPHIRTFFQRPRGDRIWNSSVGFHYQIACDREIVLRWSGYDLDSDIDQFDYQESQMDLTVIFYRG